MRYQRRQAQRGFALLLVFAMAAAALVMLYLEMPRVAFEHQRDKEALLIDRGEEYVRAIQLYVQKYRKYPQSIDDLETANNVRFLRKRFRDPITGEQEWRLIHIDAAGQYIDSLVHKRQDTKKEGTTHVLEANVQGIGVSAQAIVAEGDTQSVNPALRRTASDRILPGLAPGQQPPPGSPGENETPAEGTPGQEAPPASLLPPQPGSGTPVSGEPGSPGAAPAQPGGFRLPGSLPQAPAGTAQQNSPQPGAQPAIGYGSGGIGSYPGAAPPPPPSPGGGPAPGLTPPQIQPGAPGYAAGAGQAGTPRPGAPNEALQAIQRILTRQPAVGAQQAGGVMLGGGIAGVASKADMEGIRSYNDRTNYKEWEFLFDFRKALQAAGLGTGQPGAPGQGSPQSSSPFERPPGSTGFGGFGGFGGTGSGQPRPAPPVRP